MVGARPVGYIQSVEKLNSGPQKTNQSCGRVEDLNPGPPDYKSSFSPRGEINTSSSEPAKSGTESSRVEDWGGLDWSEAG